MFNFWDFPTPLSLSLYRYRIILGLQMRFVFDLFIRLSLTIYELLFTRYLVVLSFMLSYAMLSFH